MSGQTFTAELVDPPPVRLDPVQAVSCRLRDGQAYATWIEAACLKLAVCLDRTKQQPVALLCRNLLESLGPAGLWLQAAGFQFGPAGLSSPRC